MRDGDLNPGSRSPEAQRSEHPGTPPLGSQSPSEHQDGYEDHEIGSSIEGRCLLPGHIGENDERYRLEPTKNKHNGVDARVSHVEHLHAEEEIQRSYILK